MPVTWEVSPGLVTITAVGRYEVAEYTNAIEAALRSPSFRAPSALLLDSSASRRYVVAPADMQISIDKVLEARRRGLGERIAIVNSGQRQRLHMAGIFMRALQEAGIKVQLFLDRTLAEHWLEHE